jgi:uncharacterized protein
MLTLTAVQYLLGAGAGTLVGFSLGLVGGGGSILAVPLMVYLVGVTNPHIAIGTSALAVAANAATNLIHHARRGHVQWQCAGVFAAAGVIGALLGSTFGKNFDGQKLLALFALLMLVIAVLMFRNRSDEGDAGVHLNRRNAPKLAVFGGLTGILSGFFGIGGGFLIVPGLMAATRMPILYAVGSSLVAVTAFGLTTALNYAHSGLIDWALAAVFILGGLIGGAIGARVAVKLSARRGRLNWVFAALIVVVALYMLYQNARVMGWMST